MIDVVGLRALIAVSRLGSVARAAESLGYTPSAVSQQVKKLERALGSELLERHGRGVLLTERGRSLAAGAGGVLDDLDRLASEASRGDEWPAAPLRIASFSTGTRALFAPLLARLAGAGIAPLPHITSVDPFQAIRDVSDGAADLALIHDWQSVPLRIPENVATEHLLRDEADVVMSAGHRLAGRASIRRDELVDEAWASTPKGAICHEALQRIFSDLGAAPRIVAEDPEFSTLIDLAAHGVAIALVPRLGRPPLAFGTVAVPLADHSQVRDVRVAYRRTMAESGGVRHAIALLRETAGALA